MSGSRVDMSYNRSLFDGIFFFRPPNAHRLRRGVERHCGDNKVGHLIRFDMPVSSACQSPAPTSLQRLPVSSAYQSPTPTILQRLPFSSAYQSPAPTILQRMKQATRLAAYLKPFVSRNSRSSQLRTEDLKKGYLKPSLRPTLFGRGEID
jgi:hypothetical protein